jgi:predicted tellurium resistance membrane protein TerC
LRRAACLPAGRQSPGAPVGSCSRSRSRQSIALTGGPAGEWTTVYLIERSLSLDNVFLFSLLLAFFLVPTELRGRVIAIAIAGALLLRGVAIVAGVTLIESVEAVIYAFGALLIYVAYRAFRGAAEQSDPSANRVLRLVRRTIPTTDEFRGRRLVIREAGRLYGTPLLLVVVAIMLADIAFAVDSIPASFAVSRDPVAADLVDIGDFGSLAVIATLIAGGVVASLVADRLDPPHPVEEAARRPPRCPGKLESRADP